MTCREFAEFILEYVEGRLPATVLAAFERHLAECPQCVAYLDNYMATLELEKVACRDPESDVPEDVPRDLIQAILASVDRR